MATKTLEKGSSKIQKICDALKYETLEPAKNEAQKIIKEAEERAEQIVDDAAKQAEALLESARKKIEQEKNVFHSSLEQAGAQSVEALRQEIEKSLFNPNLQEAIHEQMGNPEVIARLIEAIIAAIQKEGSSVDIDALVPNTVKAKEVNGLIGEKILSSLKDKSVSIGNFTGGVKVQLRDKRMTLEITERTLQELLARYARKDFRKAIFGIEKN